MLSRRIFIKIQTYKLTIERHTTVFAYILWSTFSHYKYISYTSTQMLVYSILLYIHTHTYIHTYMSNSANIICRNYSIVWPCDHFHASAIISAQVWILTINLTKQTTNPTTTNPQQTTSSRTLSFRIINQTIDWKTCTTATHISTV